MSLLIGGIVIIHTLSMTSIQCFWGHTQCGQSFSCSHSHAFIYRSYSRHNLPQDGPDPHDLDASPAVSCRPHHPVMSRWRTTTPTSFYVGLVFVLFGLHVKYVVCTYIALLSMPGTLNGVRQKRLKKFDTYLHEGVKHLLKRSHQSSDRFEKNKCI